MSEIDAEKMDSTLNIQEKVNTGNKGEGEGSTAKNVNDIVIDLPEEFLDSFQKNMELIDAAFKVLVSSVDDQFEQLDGVFQVANNIKKQGEGYNFDLVAKISDQLCRLLEKLNSCGDLEIRAIRVYIDSMKVVFSQQVEGKGTEASNKIIAELEKVFEKVMSKSS
ncbi:MAG: hypothetical protein CBB68_11460 [Rhodospirillaceae bacterium TMED8]|nr:hypothetical protein [Magnetovibrio sp.]OUT49614.1 MAG: hypothetical protein CBB68_11460 [Rhodospirillaceae bacterium TMED8]|tara:strand:- start:264 stop:758 length:495 start_codon:yes stop_codon:yes gene_type:complete